MDQEDVIFHQSSHYFIWLHMHFKADSIGMAHSDYDSPQDLNQALNILIGVASVC